VPSWDISPSGVHDVLGRAEAVASEFEGQMRTRDGELQGAVGQASSGLVARALQGFDEAHTASIGFAFSRSAAAMTGAAQATQAYVEGDLEMAANAQAAASATPDPRGSMPGGGGRAPR
jgi:hypothetical protein